MERKNSRDSAGLLSKMGQKIRNGLTNGTNGVSNGGDAAKGEFDDLIKALRTGDVFGEDMAKYKRNRKSRTASTNGNGSPPRLASTGREDSRERVILTSAQHK